MPAPTSFRLLTDTLQMRVAPEAQRFNMPVNFIPPEADSFWIENYNGFWVRFKGSGSAPGSGNSMSGSYVPVTLADADGVGGNGRAIPPGFVGVFGTQFPRYLSLISAPYQGLTAGTGWVGFAWGTGQ